MTISKFLMNVAVCAVSIGGVSTSYGADSFKSDDTALVDGFSTPVRGSQASLLEGGSSARHLEGGPSWSGILRGANQDADTRSVSSMSVLGKEKLNIFLTRIYTLCQESGLSVPQGTNKIEVLEAYVAAIVADRAEKVRVMTTMAQQSPYLKNKEVQAAAEAQEARIAALKDKEVQAAAEAQEARIAALKDAEKALKAEIAALKNAEKALKAEIAALNAAAVEAEKNSVFWRNIAGGVGVAAVSLAVKAIYDNWSKMIGS